MWIRNMSGFSGKGFHTGSVLFAGISDYTGVGLDQINFVVSQLLILSLSALLRTYLKPSNTTPTCRHLFELILGLPSGIFCFGKHFLHVLLMPAVCYSIMGLVNPRVMQRVVFVFCMSYLAALHLYRQFYHYGSYSIDITGPIMVMTQKVTSLAFSLHDGLTKRDDEMTKTQKEEVITRLPNALEFFGYCLTFQTIMAGPAIPYKRYVDFIGATEQNEGAAEPPSPLPVVCRKLAVALSCGVGYLLIGNVYTVKEMTEHAFVENTSIPYKFWYMYVIGFSSRLKYYFAWIFADAVCNNSGLGFDGYDAEGRPRWDGVSNVDIIKFETASNLRETIDAWNIRTNAWLRFVCYERASKYATLQTYMLSALWHGFYPGYYATFITAALLTVAARTVRRFIRPIFIEKSKPGYDVLTTLTTRLAITYAVAPFVLLELGPSINLYKSLWWNFHVLSILTIVFVPLIFPKPRDMKKKLNEINTTDSIKFSS